MTDSLDLDPASREALELGAVLEWVAGHAATPMGADAIRELAPSCVSETIVGEQLAVSEAQRLLESGGRWATAGLPDVRPLLTRLAVDDLQIDLAGLVALARVMVAAGEVGAAFRELPPQAYPRLRELGGTVPDLREEARNVLDHVAPDGSLLDHASPELRRIRTAKARIEQRLRRFLERLVRDPAADTVVRDEFVTQRNGRYVVPVRADAHKSLGGIVHAASSSGATLFVEPLESVEANNELVRLAEREQEEVQRIVRVWTDAFRTRADDVQHAVHGLTRADSLQARGSFARRTRGCVPELSEANSFELTDVRHPLLDRRLEARGEKSVPLTLRLRPPDSVLVLSGPNTGGKTVALKTLGLAVLMAQCGIPVCARRARLPVLRQLRADIGDHQSIAADLSTFSAHVRAVTRFLSEVRPPALFLFDEIGTGTEPQEGAALAQAVLERLLASRVLTVATTHLGALKSWAFTTAGAASAALEFDLSALRPTYRVLQDMAGTSAGLQMARRLQLPRAIVRRARELVGPDSTQTEDYLNRLRARMTDLDEEHREIRELRRRLDHERAELEREAAREASRRERQAAEKFARALDDFRKKARRELAALEEGRERARLAKRRDRAEARLGAEARRRARELAAGPERPVTGPPQALIEGARVRVRSLGREGEVVGFHGRQVQVRLGNSLFTVERTDLEAGVDPPQPPGRAARREVAYERSERAVPAELLLLGRTAEDALAELDKFLDEAVLGGLHEVRVVHGHGTGRLRSAVRRFLQGHPHVEHQRPGLPAEGGNGVTVVRLRGSR